MQVIPRASVGDKHVTFVQLKFIDFPPKPIQNNPVMKLKSKFSYMLLAALAAVSPAFAVDATTTPVGYVTLTIAANSDANVTPALERSTTFSAASTSISGNVVGASGLTSGAFVTPTSYLQVTSGPLIGRRYSITGNTDSLITVDPAGASSLQTQGFSSGNTFKVVPYWTPATLFPAGAGVGSTTDVFAITSLLYVVDNGSYGVNRAPSASYFYTSGDAGNGVVAGWYDANDPFGAAKNDIPLDPTLNYFVRNGDITDKSVVVSGAVPSVGSAAVIPVTTAANDAYLGVPIPIDTTLQASGLQAVVQGTNDVFNISELVYVFDDAGLGQNKAPSASYFYCTGDTGNGVVAGWYDANDPFGSTITAAVLKAGRSIFVRKAAYVADGTLTWTLPLPYTP